MKVQFMDFWPGLDPNNNWFTQLLTKHGRAFEVVDSNPDVVIFSVFGNYKNNTDRVHKVHYTGENTPIVKHANLNLTYEVDCVDNIRLPLWILYGYDKNTQLVKKDSEGFCCFVYSNPVRYRNAFCKKLSKYKQVDCGGDCLNNVNGRVQNKLGFQSRYKFCIAFENTAKPGYTTEKILEAYKSNCIPIYWGSTSIEDDFNPETFINAHDFDNDDDLIDYIKKVDTDETLYNSYFNKPIYSRYWLDIFNDPEETYFKNIASKILTPKEEV